MAVGKMKKKWWLLFLLPGIVVFGFIKARQFYYFKQEEKRRAAFYENLQDTSTPTVTVLRDSILIGYQNHRRTVHLYVPPNYNDDTLQTFPVMYLLDGESAFNDLENMGPEWQVDEVINTATGLGEPSAIVVAINQAEDRDAEYTPFVNEDNPDAHGAKFATWVATDLKQLIDANYRTRRDAESTFIGGISRSGMMAYYMMMAHPDIFGGALIQSPAMWVDHERLMEMEISNEQLSTKKIFVSVGEHEGRVMIPHAEEIYEKFLAQGLAADRLRFEIIPGEGHWHVTWRKSFALAYPWLFAS